MAWVSTHFDNSNWEIESVNNLGYWDSGNSRWNSETYIDDNEYIILSELDTWVNSYRPTQIRLTAIGVSGGQPIQNATLHLADSSWDHIGYALNTYNGGNILDLTFSGNDIKYLLVSLGYAFYITKIEFWNNVEYTPGDITLNYRKGGETTSIVTYTTGWENALAIRANGTTYYAQCDSSTVDLGGWIATDLRARIGGNTYTIFYTLTDRGVFGGGYTGSASNVIDYITISTPINAIDFGDLSHVARGSCATSNGATDRGIISSMWDGSTNYNYIDYITIPTPGNAADFGDLTAARRRISATSNGTNDRGIFGGGYISAASNIIDYITISSVGNATDFGDLTVARFELSGTSNGTNERGVFGGGYTDTYANIIDYITISSVGNATDFGDLTATTRRLAATSNGTNERGVFGGGYDNLNVIDYITISTPSNATDFGDLTVARQFLSATSNGTNERGVFGGGNAATYTNIIDYITINSTGNAADFGYLTVARDQLSATSNA